MSAATRSHRPSLLRLDSNDNVVDASKQTPAPASSAMENRHSTRKRTAPETPEKPSTKRLKTTVTASNNVEYGEIKPAMATRRSARARSLELPYQMSPSTKDNTAAHTASPNKTKSRARQSLPVTRKSGRQRSPELLPQTPRSSTTKEQAMDNSPHSVRRSSRRKSVAFEDEEQTASQIASLQQEHAAPSNIGRNTRSGRTIAYVAEPINGDVSADGAVIDPWAIPKSPQTKPITRKNAKHNKATALQTEDENDLADTATAQAAAFIFGKKRSDITTKRKTPIVQQMPEEQVESREMNDQPANIARSSRRQPRSTAEETVDETADDEQDQAQSVIEGKKRGRPRKPRPEGWTPKKKRDKRGRPSKEDVAAREAEAETLGSEIGLLKPANKIQELINDRVVVRGQDQHEDMDGDEEAVEEGDDGLNLEIEAEEAENDDVGVDQGENINDADQEPEDQREDLLSQATRTTNGKRRTTKKSSNKKNKEGQMALVISDRYRFRSDEVGNAEREFYEALTECAERQENLRKRFNRFHRETKDERKELSDSTHALDTAFRNLVNTLDSKGTYEFAKLLQPHYDLSEMSPEDVTPFPGDPFGAYAEHFNPDDERVRHLFKDDEEKNADLDVLDNMRDVIDEQLEVSEENAIFAKRMIAAVEAPMRLLKHHSAEVADLCHHELHFPTDYQSIRMEQAERVRVVHDRQRKRNPGEKRFLSSQPSRDYGRKYAAHDANGVYYHDERNEQQHEEHDEDINSPSNEIQATPYERVSIPAFGQRRVEQKPSRDVQHREVTSSSPEVLEDTEWTENEEEALCIGMEEYGLAADNFIMIKKKFGSEPGSLLYRRSGSDIQAKASELKAIILSIPDGILPPSWAKVPVPSGRTNSNAQ